MGHRDRRRHHRARCERHTVAADLRAEWPTALRQAGFDPARPTAWLAEGLLPYLTDDAKDALLTRVHDASASGSQVALEYTDADISELVSDPAIQEAASRVDWDFTGMWPADQRHDPAMRSGLLITASLAQPRPASG
jgi:methyltransferase (TIGR00027 family)